jgi:hypothetical protein
VLKINDVVDCRDEFRDLLRGNHKRRATFRIMKSLPQILVRTFLLRNRRMTRVSPNMAEWI